MRCDVLQRDGEGPFPCLVRTEDGRLLRLHGAGAPQDAHWLGTLDGVSVWAVRVGEEEEVTDAPLGEVFIDTSSTDEIAVPVGPDHDGLGLFDQPNTDASLTGEATHDLGPSVVHRRTSVLAWIAAGAPEPVGAHVFAGRPCEPLKQIIADEPLDPLPALDGGPAPATVGAVPTLPATLLERRVPARREPEREDTATQIMGLPMGERTAPDGAPPAAPEERSLLPLVATAVALIVIGSLFVLVLLRVFGSTP